MQPERMMWSQAIVGCGGGGSWATSGLFWTTDTLKQPLPAQELLEVLQDVLPPEWLVSGTRVAGRKWDGGVGDRLSRAFLGMSPGYSRPSTSETG